MLELERAGHVSGHAACLGDPSSRSLPRPQTIILSLSTLVQPPDLRLPQSLLSDSRHSSPPAPPGEGTEVQSINVLSRPLTLWRMSSGNAHGTCKAAAALPASLPDTPGFPMRSPRRAYGTHHAVHPSHAPPRPHLELPRRCVRAALSAAAGRLPASASAPHPRDAPLSPRPPPLQPTSCGS